MFWYILTIRCYVMIQKQSPNLIRKINQFFQIFFFLLIYVDSMSHIRISSACVMVSCPISTWALPNHNFPIFTCGMPVDRYNSLHVQSMCFAIVSFSKCMHSHTQDPIFFFQFAEMHGIHLNFFSSLNRRKGTENIKH